MTRGAAQKPSSTPPFEERCGCCGGCGGCGEGALVVSGAGAVACGGGAGVGSTGGSAPVDSAAVERGGGVFRGATQRWDLYRVPGSGAAGWLGVPLALKRPTPRQSAREAKTLQLPAKPLRAMPRPSAGASWRRPAKEALQRL